MTYNVSSGTLNTTIPYHTINVTGWVESGRALWSTLWSHYGSDVLQIKLTDVYWWTHLLLVFLW